MNHDQTWKKRWSPVRRTAVNCIVDKRRKRSTGQSIVEFALIAPLLLLLIFGIIDMARLIQAQVTVSNSARAGVRYAITGQREQNGDGTYKTREESIKNVAKASLNGLPLANTVYSDEFGFYSINLNDENGGGTAGGPNELIEVRVYYNVQMLTPLVNAVLPRVLVMGYERGLNEEWGAVQTFNHANLPPAPPDPPTWTPAATRTPLPPTQTYVAGVTQTAQAAATATWAVYSTQTSVAGQTNTAITGQTQTAIARVTNTAVAAQTQTAVVVQTSTAVAGQTNTAITGQTQTAIARVTNTAIAAQTQTAAVAQTSTARVNQTNTAVAGQTNTAVAAVTNTAAAAQTQTTAARQTSTAVAAQTNTAVAGLTATSVAKTAVAAQTQTALAAQTQTASARQTQTATAAQLRLQNVRFVKPDGSGQGLDIAVDLVDGYGAAVGGATVNVTGAWTGSLLQFGAATYYRCSVGSFGGSDGGDVTITITASKAGYQSVTVTVTNTEGNLC